MEEEEEEEERRIGAFAFRLWALCDPLSFAPVPLRIAEKPLCDYLVQLAPPLLVSAILSSKGRRRGTTNSRF